MYMQSMSDPGNGPQVRLANVNDAQAIARVHVESWRATYPGIVPQDYIDSLDVEVFAERWRDRLHTQPELVIYVAEESGEIRGFASGGPARTQMDGFPGELYAIYLAPQAKSQGVGKRLFWAVAEALRRAGYEGIYVWVLDDNPSLGFYRHMGGCRISEAEIELGGKTLKEVSYGWSNLAPNSR